MNITNTTSATFITFPEFRNLASTQTFITDIVRKASENWVNPKFLEVPFAVADQTFTSQNSTNFIYSINYRQDGYKMDDTNLNKTDTVFNGIKADQWTFNLQRFITYPMQINTLGRRLGSEWSSIYSKQVSLAINWLLRTNRNFMRYRIKQTILATRQYGVATDFLTNTAKREDYAYKLVHTLRNKYNEFVTGFNNINYGLDQARVNVLMSYPFEQALLDGATKWGGSNAAFQVFTDGKFQSVLGMTYLQDMYLGNATGRQEIKDSETGLITKEDIDLTNLGCVIGIVGGFISPSTEMQEASWKINGPQEQHAWYWNYDFAPLPWMAKYFYGIFTSAPTLAEVKAAQDWMTAIDNNGRFFKVDYPHIAVVLTQNALNTVNTDRELKPAD